MRNVRVIIALLSMLSIGYMLGRTSGFETCHAIYTGKKP